MFCLIRSAKTTHCIIFCDTPLDIAKKFNSENPNKFDEHLYFCYKIMH